MAHTVFTDKFLVDYLKTVIPEDMIFYDPKQPLENNPLKLSAMPIKEGAPKAPKTGRKGGVDYLSIDFRIPGVPPCRDIHITNTQDITILPLNDPEIKPDPYNDVPNWKLLSNVNEAGIFGECVRKLNILWRDALEKMLKDPKNRLRLTSGMVIRDIIQMNYSENNPDPEKVGKPIPIESHWIRLKLLYGMHPQNHPNKYLAGKPRVQIYDGSKPNPNSDTDIKYEKLTIDIDGITTPAEVANLYKYVNVPCLVHRGSQTTLSPNRNATSYSCPMNVNILIISVNKQLSGVKVIGWEDPEDENVETNNAKPTPSNETPQPETTTEEVQKIIDNIESMNP